MEDVPCGRTAEEDRQISWQMALYLEGKMLVDAN